MKKSIFIAITLVLLTSSLWAQNRGINRGGVGPGVQTGVPRDLTTIEGNVESVNLGFGQGNPSIVVSGVQINLGPYSYLQRSGFEVETGDAVRISAFPSAVYENTFVAVSIENLDKGISVQLRSETGQPPRAARRQGFRQRMGGLGPCGGNPDLESAQTFNGTVGSVTVGLGQGSPRVTLEDGTVFTVGPYRVWRNSDFSVAAGDHISVVAFPCAADSDRWVAMRIDNQTNGTSIILRDDSGIPVGGRGWSRGGASRIIPE